MKTIRLVPLVVLLPLLLATAALAVWMIATVWATFYPDAHIEIGSHDGSNESSVNASVTSFYELPAGDVNFDALVTYTPPEWFVAAGEDIPLGATVGVLEANQTLGLVFTPCNITLLVNFDLTPLPGETRGMVNASTDTSDTFTSTGNISRGPNAMTNKWNGYDIMPSGNYRAVDQYPSFLSDLYPAEPRARYIGVAYIGPLATWVVVQFLVFEPGTNIAAGIPNDPDWGYGSLTVLNNPTVVDPTSSLGDVCTPFNSQDTVFGETEDGDPLRTNPQYGGTYTFRTWSRGQPDADGDGFENSIDTCPFDPDPPSEDPRTTRGPDWGGGDFIMSSCDPDPNVSCWPGAPGQNDNCDDDLFANVADNCPLIPNNDQAAGGDADMDDIGDVCDTRGNGPNVVDGDRPEYTIETPVEIEGPPQRPADVKIVSQSLVNPPSQITQGQNVDVTLRKTLHNNGPFGPVDISIAASAQAPAGCTATPSGTNPSSADLPVSTTVVVDEVWTLNCSETGNKYFSFDNAISSSDPSVVDPDTTNNSGSALLSVAVVTPAPDLALAKTDSPDPVLAGRSLSYELKVYNNGPSDAVGVVVEDDLPDQVDFVRATISNGTGTCVLIEVPPAPPSKKLSCQLGTMPPNFASPLLIYIEVLVKSGTPDGSLITNTAFVSSATSDPNPTNDSASTSTTVLTRADLAITKTSDADIYKPSATIRYAITVVNSGPSDAQNVVVTDELPTTKQAVYVFDTGGCTKSGLTLTCNLGMIAAGGSKSFNVYVKVKGSRGQVTNTASVAGSTFDPSVADNSSARVILIGR